MAERSTQDRVLAVLSVQTGKPAITLDATFKRDLNFDSLDVVETSVLLEDEFGMQTTDEEVGQFETVGELVAYMEGRVSG